MQFQPFFGASCFYDLLVVSITTTARADENIPAWAEESTAIYYKANKKAVRL